MSARRIAALAALALAAVPAAAAAAVLPPGFEDVPLATGMRRPTAAAWGPDGRVYVAEKAGRVRVVEADGRLRAQPLIDISGHVNSYWDRGLTDLALAPDFATSGRIYLLYAAERDPAHPEAVKAARLTRITVGPGGEVTEPETPILGGAGGACAAVLAPAADCLPIDWGVHGTGTVIADPDGTLWMSLGDGKESGVVLSPLTFRPFDPALPSGKVLHVDGTGRGLPGHPFCPGETDLALTCTKVFASGLRNAFRFARLPAGGLLVGDVGWDQTEELDVAHGGESFGWPCVEGDHPAPSYSELAGCAPGAAPAATAPLHTYSHGAGKSVLAGPAYGGGDWPDGYDGRSFFADTISGAVWTIAPAAPASVAAFGTGLEFPVDLDITPAGDLGYVAHAAGALRAIRWSPGNYTPHAAATASATYGAVPLTVEFGAGASTDRDGDALTYAWDFGDGASATGPDAEHVYTTAGLFPVRLTVTDTHGASAVADLLIGPGNSPPELDLTAPADGATYRVGDTVALGATATDAQDGTLPPGSIEWSVVLRHGDHRHGLLDRSGTVSGFTTVTTHGAGSSYEVTATAVDAGGLSSSRTVTLQPQLAPVALKSSPAGAALAWDGRVVTAPASFAEAVGYRPAVSAPATLVRAGATYRFAGWSDGGARVHAVAIPAAGMQLEARYEPPAPPATGSTPAPPPALGFDVPRGRPRALHGRARALGAVAISLRTRAGCRFWAGALGRLEHRTRSCARKRWIAAAVRRGRWRLELGGRLPRGRYALALRGRAGTTTLRVARRFRAPQSAPDVGR